MKEPVDLALFWALRPLERMLSVDALHGLLKPSAFLRAAIRAGFRKAPRPVELPGCFEKKAIVQRRRLERMDYYLNLILQDFPDRLATPKWRARLRVSGSENIQSARQSGRPIIFASTHFGPFYLVRYWLRALDLPVAALIGGQSGNEPLLKRLKDRRSPLPHLSTAFYRDQLREAAEFLTTGNSLVISIDFPSGKQMSAPVRDGWIFDMPTGAIRLAANHEAELVPLSIIDEGAWRFRLVMGKPVPREFLTRGSDPAQAGAHLIRELLPVYEAYPEQCPKYLLDRFKKRSAVSDAGKKCDPAEQPAPAMD
jgi:lauroyl/myristoyl acyltransferase